MSEGSSSETRSSPRVANSETTRSNGARRTRSRKPRTPKSSSNSPAPDAPPDASRPATPKRNPGRRNQNKAADKSKSNSRSTKSTKPAKVKEVKNDYRYLEIIKLLKNHQPVTINGIASTKILEDAQNQESENSLPPHKQIANYIHQLMTNYPNTDIYLSFKLTPSDPEFPYDLTTLNFNLCVPASYPYSANSRPSIVVLNSDIPRGFAVNVELGFKKIVAIAMVGEKYVLTRPKPEGESELEGEDEEEVPITLVEGKGLLSQIKTLDRYLEEFLKQEKRQTIKFITFKEDNLKKDQLNRQQQLDQQQQQLKQQQQQQEQEQRERQRKLQQEQQQNVKIDPKVIARRNEILDETVTKLGTKMLKLFNKNPAGNKYELTIPLPRSNSIPHLWKLNQYQLRLMLHVPIDYPIKPASISAVNNFSTNLLIKYKSSLDPKDQSDPKKLIEIVGDCRKFEKNLVLNFNERSFSSEKHQSLVYVINWLVNNIDKLGALDRPQYDDFISNMSKLNKMVI